MSTPTSRSLIARGELTAAERTLLEALRHHPGDPALHLDATRLYEALNEPERVAMHLGRARELLGDDLAVAARAAMLRVAEARDHLAHGDGEAAVEVLAPLVADTAIHADDGPHLEAILLAGIAEAACGRHFRAHRLLDRAVEEIDFAAHPELAARALLHLGLDAGRRGEPARATTLLDRAGALAEGASLEELRAEVERARASLLDATDPAAAVVLRSRARQRLRQIADRLPAERRRSYLAHPARAALLDDDPQADPEAAAPASAGSAATARMVATLSEMSALINSLTDLDEMLDRVMDIALAIVGAERGLVVLFEPDIEHMNVRVARNLDGRSIAGSTDFSRNVLRQVAEGHEIITFDTAEDAWLSRQESVALYSIRSLVCLPLRVREQILGAVYLDTRSGMRAYADADLEFLRAFTNLAAIAIDNSRLLKRLQQENVYLKRVASERYGRSGIIGTAPAMEQMFRLVDKAMDSSFPVLITGETGTGKEIITKAIHFGSPRKDKPFVAQNCAAIPSELLESEMFGYKRGSFTGAHTDKKGLFESAHGGTLFLDEIGELGLALQAKLLRVLQDGRIRRIGETSERQVDVRIISATNRDLKQAVDQGRFRLDLIYRLNVIQVDLPPLRDRAGDIPLLAQHFLDKNAADTGRRFRGFTKRAIDRLRAYSWPGNVRELENVVARAVVFAEGDVIDLDSLPELVADRPPGSDRKSDPAAAEAQRLYRAIQLGEGDFWEIVKKPFLKRDLSRQIARGVVALALEASGWRYTRALAALDLPADEYRRFMNFLAKFDLKVARPRS